MDNIRFEKIFDFDNNRAKKLSNSSYLEDLTGLLESVASKIRSGKDYFFDREYFSFHSGNPNNSYDDFIKEFTNSFLHGSEGDIHIIRGQAGIGKTLFFEKGIQILIRKETDRKDKYIKLGVDFRSIDQKQKIEFYENYIYNNLCDNAIDAIRYLNPHDIYLEFNKQYKEFCPGDRHTHNDYLFPVMFFCKEIFYKYNRPCIIIFDNIDLSCAETQKNVFDATTKVCIKLKEFMSNQGHERKHCVYFAMRPETNYHRRDANVDKIINFPLPNILKITLELIKKNLLETAEEFDKDRNLKCHFEFFDIIENIEKEVTTFSDVARYFNLILDHYLLNLWQGDIINRLGKNEEFHCDIVNNNVRTFLLFLSDTIRNGGFKPLTKEFNAKPYVCHYTVFDYVEMIIRGKWTVHPGNRFIDGEGGNEAPIIFNIFDTRLWNNTQSIKIKHFMLYIRILQFLGFADDEKILYSDLENSLNCFFDIEYINKAIKQLIYVRMVFSFSEGDLSIENKNNFNEVIVENTTGLRLSECGKFYINKMIYEFEYLYQMSLSSLMPSIYINELAKCYKTEKELTVLYFLEGIYKILKINIKNYNEDDLISFKKLFSQDNNNICKPYRKMLQNFITVMKNKIQSAEKNETNRLEKLRKILNEAEKLENNANSYFSLIMEE